MKGHFKYIWAVVIIILVILLAKFANAEEPRWVGEVAVSYATIEGNSDNRAMNVELEIGRETDYHNVKFYGEAIYGKSNDEVDTEYYQLGFRDMHTVNKIKEKGFFWAQQFSWEQNKIAGVDLRLEGSINGGYQYDNKWFHFLVEAGPGGLYEERIVEDGGERREDVCNNEEIHKHRRGKGHYENGSEGYEQCDYIEQDDLFAEFMARGYVELSVSFEAISLNASIEHLYPLEESEDYRTTGKGYINIVLWEGLSIRPGIRVEYVNRPPAGAERTDVYTNTSLVWGW
jgi:putative salt-induced outer membrane protein YdiY